MTTTVRAASVNVTSTDAGVLTTPLACSAGGDSFHPTINGKANDYYFYNGSGGTLTVTLVHQLSAQRVPGLGTVTPGDKALAILTVSSGLFRIEAADLPEYMDGTGLVNFTYSGVTTLTVVPISH